MGHTSHATVEPNTLIKDIINQVKEMDPKDIAKLIRVESNWADLYPETGTDNLEDITGEFDIQQDNDYYKIYHNNKLIKTTKNRQVAEMFTWFEAIIGPDDCIEWHGKPPLFKGASKISPIPGYVTTNIQHAKLFADPLLIKIDNPGKVSITTKEAMAILVKMERLYSYRGSLQYLHSLIALTKL